MLYQNLPFEDRIERIAAAGFEGVEFWDWRNMALDTLASTCREKDLIVTNMSGQRAGSLIDSREFELYRDEVVASFDAARRVGCENLMLLTNPLGPNGEVLDIYPELDTYPEISQQNKLANCEQALIQLASLAARAGVRLLLEPLNTIIDHPGYWLDDADLAFDLIHAVGHPSVKLLYDLYHMRAMGRDVCGDIEGNLDLIGYFHAADFPGRHEPGTGSMDYSSILQLLRSLEYDGFVGFEFSPSRSSDVAVSVIQNLVGPYL